MKKSCMACKDILENDEVALNKKLFSKSVQNFYCLKCLADYLELPEELLKQKIVEFKKQGCGLFI